MEWIVKHWPIPTIVAALFTAGMAYSDIDKKVQTIDELVAKQLELMKEQQDTNKFIVRLDEQVKTAREKQIDIEDKIDFLIQLHLQERQRNE